MPLSAQSAGFGLSRLESGPSSGRFRLDTSITPVLEGPVHQPRNVLDSQYSSFRAFAPEPLPQYGDFVSDSKNPKYNMRWDSWQDFEQFLSAEENSKSVELRQVRRRAGGYLLSSNCVSYVCSRRGTGGTKEYTKQHPEWNRNVGSKITGCAASLTVKTYKDIGTVLGIYRETHNHPLGGDNLRFTRISQDTREWIAAMVRMKVKSDHILEVLHQNYVSQSTNRTPHRNDFIVLADVRRIEKAVEAENVRFNQDDGQSSRDWAEKLRAEGSLLCYKSVSCPPPPDSRLPRNAFCMIIQTDYQRTMFQEFGGNIIFIDGTHNTTMYENVILTTILVRNKWGHGVPVAWMLASSGSEETLSYFLSLFRQRNPKIIPKRIMSDRDMAALNSCERWYPESIILLCWWHVLHAWQQHFVISKHPDLWTKLKAWIRITDQSEFDAAWVEIKSLAPPDFIVYLEVYWVVEKFRLMWSAVHRIGRHIYEMSETNMIAEAWHHVLKGKFLEGRRNRRLDHLLYILIIKVMPYYSLKDRRQEFGFEGTNLEVSKRKAIEGRSMTISKAQIEHQDEGLQIFLVISSSDSTRRYEVDIIAYTCTCPDYPLIKFCKHLCAVQRHYPDVVEPQQFTGCTLGSEQITPPNDSNRDRIQLSDLPSDSRASVVPSAPTLSTSIRLAEKLERLAGRMRAEPHVEPEIIVDLEREIVRVLTHTQGKTQLIPLRSGFIPPNVKSWTETKAVMVRMPPKKTRAKRAGDAVYGAGEQSGKRVKKSKEYLPDHPHPIATTSMPPPPLPQAALLTHSAAVSIPTATSVINTPSPYYRIHTYR